MAIATTTVPSAQSEYPGRRTRVGPKSCLEATVVNYKFRADLIRQREIDVYTFTVSAEVLVAISRVERFGDHSDGVNRQFDERKVLAIAESMLRPDTVMLDSICGDLKGEWTLEDGFLVPGDDAYLSVDDGQHRRGACEVLNPEERARWTFPVVATRGLDYETRLRIFRQQRLRKPIDTRLDLAMRYKLDEWGSAAERQAYELILRLNSDTSSPLRGMLILEEKVKRPYENRHRTEGINASGVWASLKSVMGKGSPLYALSLEKRAEVALNLIFVASEVWSRAWRSNEHVLTTARGINAVLSLIVSGPNFRIVIGDDFRIESLRAALEMGVKFNWTAKAHRNSSQREITLSLDEVIGRAHQRKIESGQTEIVA